MDSKDEMIATALAEWRALAPKVAPGAADAPAEVLKARLGPKEARVVLRIDAAPALVFKRSFRGLEPAAFADALRGHREAEAALAGHRTARVPALRHGDPDRQCLVIEHAPGLTAQETMLLDYEDPARRRAALARAGAWLAAFHGAMPTPAHPFDPSHVVRFSGQLAEMAETRAEGVARRKDFLAAVARFHDWAEEFRGRQIRTARTHGDIHLRNLVFDGDVTWGFDFRHAHSAPIGYDVAALLVDHATQFADLRRLAPGALLPDDELAAFFEGYGSAAAGDAGIAVMGRLRVLQAWFHMPRRKEDRHELQHHRFQALMRIARGMFGI